MALNQDVPVATLTAQGAGTVVSSPLVNTEWRGILLGINITAITAGSLTVTIQGQDQASGVWYNILVGAALVGTGITVMTVYPGAATTANVSSPSPLPRNWRVSYTVATGPVTATIGASVIV